MPAAFNETERMIIRSVLRERGYALFASQGLKKTSVEELAQAASISKGAFYLFYTSKEALFFELLEDYEADFQRRLLAQIARQELPPPERMRAMLHSALEVWKQNELFSRFSRESYEQLLRKLPQERVAAHLANDEAFAGTFVAAWRESGVDITVPPALVAGLIRALFFVSMHAEDLGDTYTMVIETLVVLVSQHLVASGETR